MVSDILANVQVTCFANSNVNNCPDFNRRMALSEVQLMHNMGKHKQVQERQDWLQKRLEAIDTRAMSGTATSDKGRLVELTTKDPLPSVTQ